MAMAEISCRQMASVLFENRRTSIQMTLLAVWLIIL
jgi:hypothetical protein